MKTNIRKLFSLSVLDSEYFNDKQDKIELVSSIELAAECKEYFKLINKNYLESDRYRREKDFQRSIEKLQNEFYRTMELKNTPFMKYSDLVRIIITDSLNSIKWELKYMSTGFFSSKRYRLSYKKVDQVLEEIEKSQLPIAV